MSSETPIRAVVTSRFDLGFILKHPDGLLGQLRVPEMSAATAALDRAGEPDAGLGVELDVYVIKLFQDTYLFSEYSGAERQERERQEQLAVEARSRVPIGEMLTVTVNQKGDWGCLCRDASGPLEGIVLSRVMLEKEGWSNPEMLAASHLVDQLTVGSLIEVRVARKEWSSRGRYVVYFGTTDPKLDGS
jgi:hypothetical protein